MKTMTHSEIHDQMMETVTTTPVNWRKYDALRECQNGEWLAFQIHMGSRANKSSHRRWEFQTKLKAISNMFDRMATKSGTESSESGGQAREAQRRP